MLDLNQIVKIINGWTIVKYTEKQCKTWRIPFPTYAAFYASVPEFNPSFEECSTDTLEKIERWCEEHY